MSTEDHKAIVRRYRELHNSNDLAQLGEIVAPDVITHNLLPGMPPGLMGAKLAHRATRMAFPDTHCITEDLIAEGDRVVERWTQTQTHTGVSIFGLPANTGKTATTTGISIYRIANGKIVEHWAEMDTLSVLQQLGAMPAPHG